MSHVGKTFRIVLGTHAKCFAKVSWWYYLWAGILVHIQHSRCGCWCPSWSPSSFCSCLQYSLPKVESWNHVSIQQMFLEYLPLYQAQNSCFVLLCPTSL